MPTVALNRPALLLRAAALVVAVAMSCVLIAPPTRAQETRPADIPLAGRLVNEWFYSDVLGAWVPYYVYLPPRYDAEAQRRYPVLYMLHGAGGNYTEWTDSWLHSQLDDMIVRGELPPMIVVMPEGGERTYWVDWEPNGPRWSEYLVRDVLGETDRRYRTLDRRESRAIGGLSAGGFGALHIALRYPELFAAVGAHSPSIRTEPDPELWFMLGANFYEHSPSWLVHTRRETLGRLAIWVDVGSEDWWRPNIEEFRDTLESLDVPFTWRVYPGTHEAEYWIFNIPNYLRFYASHLRGDDLDLSPPSLQFGHENAAIPF